jgi:hypothetical protein
MELVYTHRPPLQRSDSAPRSGGGDKGNEDLFYPFVKNVQPKKIVQKVEPSPVIEKIGRFTIVPSSVVSKNDSYTIEVMTPKRVVGFNKFRAKKSRTKKSRTKKSRAKKSRAKKSRTKKSRAKKT